jgi:hypothetical protein
VYRTLAAYSDLAGGQLRNVVVAAAAASEGGAITELALLEGVRTEYLKIGRNLPAKLEQLRSARAACLHTA